MSTAFDTLAAAEALEQAGATPKLAKAHAAQLRSAAEAARGELATRADLAELKAATKADIAELKAELKADLNSLTWRMIGLVVAANGVMAAVLGGLLVAVLDRLP